MNLENIPSILWNDNYPPGTSVFKIICEVRVKSVVLESVYYIRSNTANGAKVKVERYLIRKRIKIHKVIDVSRTPALESNLHI